MRIRFLSGNIHLSHLSFFLNLTIIFLLCFSCFSYAVPWQIDSDAAHSLSIEDMPSGRWVYCSEESMRCDVPMPSLVKYGDSDTYYYKNISNETWCDNNTFGNPLPYTRKRCYYFLSDTNDYDDDGIVDSLDVFPADSSESFDQDKDGIGDNSDLFALDPTNAADSNWVYCSSEGERCRLPIPSIVRYGDGVAYSYRQITDLTWCDNNTFGNPIHAHKHCDYLLSDTADFDGDDVVDSQDVFPADELEFSDQDSDGLGDNSDPFPADPTNAADSSWVYCSDEGERCRLPIPSIVRYGDSATYSYRKITDLTWCDNNTFGNPIHAHKHCDYLLSDTADFDGDGVVDSQDVFPADELEFSDQDSDGLGDNSDPFPADPTNAAEDNWVYCSSEGQRCHLPFTTFPMLVRYGENKTYFYRKITDQTWCDNNTFGNPIYARKHCDYLLSDIADFDGDGVVDSEDVFPGDASDGVDSDSDNLGDNSDPYPADLLNNPAANWVRCANEWAGCYVPLPAVVRYGANGQYFYKQLEEGYVVCSNAIFDNPIPSAVKHCDYLISENGDFDGDGVIDALDAFPSNAGESVDSDGDGIGDNLDPFPSDAQNNPSQTWLSCANEGETCQVDEPSLVRYGAQDSYHFQIVTESIACNNTSFRGDPVSGVYKSCDYLTHDFDLAPIITNVKEQEGWFDVGGQGSSLGIGDNPVISIDNRGIPYIAYSDRENSFRATVRRFNGVVWETVGAAGFSTGYASPVSMSIDHNNVPYVVYSDFGGVRRAVVKRFNGMVWETVGAEGISVGSVSYASIRFDNNNVPYVTYADVGYSLRAVVKRFNGTAWRAVGDQVVSQQEALSPSISFDNDNELYIMYGNRLPTKGNAASSTVIVKRFNSVQWETVSEGYFSESGAHPVISMDSNNVPHVFYSDSSKYGRATVKRFNGAIWEAMGEEGFSTASSVYHSIAMDTNNDIYVAYVNFPRMPTVKKFNGTTWENIGDKGVSERAVGEFSITIDDFNVPYVIYSVSEPWNQYQKDLEVKRFYDGSIYHSVSEHQINAIDINATDIYDGMLLYSLADSYDASLFSIDESNGIVTFITSPDTQDPQDSNQDNTYTFEVKVVNEYGGVTIQKVNILVLGGKPTLTTTPTTTTLNKITVEVNGQPNSQVFVNGVDTGKVLNGAGVVSIDLDTSGADGEKIFSLTLINQSGKESNSLNVTILKCSIALNTPTLTATPTATAENSINIEVNGNKQGERVFVNGVDINTVLSTDKKAVITLDTSGEEGHKYFTIKLKREGGDYFSEPLLLSIYKDGTAPELLSGWPKNNETIALGNTNNLDIIYTFTDSGGISSIKVYDSDGNDVSASAAIDSHSIVLNLTPNRDGYYNYTIVASDHAGYKKEVVLDFAVKRYAPTTIASLPSGFYDEAIAIDLISDEESTIYYSTDGYPPMVGAANTQQGLGKIKNIALSSTANVQYFAIDAAGNREKTNSTVYRFDEINDYNAVVTANYDAENNQVNLSWKNSLDAKAYKLYRVSSQLDLDVLKRSKGQKYLAPTAYFLERSEGYSFTDTKISLGANYYYAVSKVDLNELETLISEPVSVIIKPKTSADQVNDAITRAKNWLYSVQNHDGSWGTNKNLKLLETTSALDGLYHFKDENKYIINKGLANVFGSFADNNDYLSRQILTLSIYGLYKDDKVNKLLSQSTFSETHVQGWGLLRRYEINALDTALAFQAIKTSEQDFQKRTSIAWNLKNNGLLNPQGHWSWTKGGESSIYISALVYHAINADPSDYAWIEQSQNLDGSFGNGLLDTVGVVLYLQLSEEQRTNAFTYIISQQNNMGDFDNNVYLSALVLQALSQGVKQ